ncbi:deoxyribodipyrimidine photo-lyase [Reichenbachiella sp.]
MKKSLVLFSNDLRLSDHPVLDYVTAQGKDYVPVYLDYNDSFYSCEFFDINLTKRKFISSGIEYLKRKLYLVDKELIIINQDHRQALVDVLVSHGCKQILISRNTTSPLNNLLESMELMLLKNNIFIHYFDSNYLIDLQDLSFPIRNLPYSFNEFCTKIKGVKLRSAETDPLVPEGVLEILDDVKKESVPVLHPYKTRLNNHFSKFLPYLSSGVVSPVELIEAVKHQASISTVFDAKTLKTLTKQLVNLDFIRASIRNIMPVTFDEVDLSSNQVAQVENWIEGNTDNDMINAIMHKLKETSVISLTSKKLTMLYYLKVLNLPAYFGYEYFQSQLLEFDSSLNMYLWKQYEAAQLDHEDLIEEIATRKKQLDPEHSFVEFWA